ncbi:hypothetical protein J132_08197 [Termitomyces sp. J132]|nr:hypothetical protein J132_08197 [Termitomyces sp. J132]
MSWFNIDPLDHLIYGSKSMSWFDLDPPGLDSLSPLLENLQELPLLPLAVSLLLAFTVFRGLPLGRSWAVSRRLRQGNKQSWILKRQDDLERVVSQQERILSDLIKASSLDSEERRCQHLEFMKRTEEKFAEEEVLRAQAIDADIATLATSNPFFRNIEEEQDHFRKGEKLRDDIFDEEYLKWKSQLRNVSRTQKDDFAKDEEKLPEKIEEVEGILGERVALSINLMEMVNDGSDWWRYYFDYGKSDGYVLFEEKGEKVNRIAGPDRETEPEEFPAGERPNRVHIPVYASSVIDGGVPESSDSRVNMFFDGNSVDLNRQAFREASVHSELPVSVSTPQPNRRPTFKGKLQSPLKGRAAVDDDDVTQVQESDQPSSISEDPNRTLPTPEENTATQARNWMNARFKETLKFAQTAEERRNYLFNKMYVRRKREAKVNRHKDYQKIKSALIPESAERDRQFYDHMEKYEERFLRLLRKYSGRNSRITPWDRMNIQVATGTIGSLGPRYKLLLDTALERHRRDFKEYMRGVEHRMKATPAAPETPIGWRLMGALWRMFEFKGSSSPNDESKSGVQVPGPTALPAVADAEGDEDQVDTMALDGDKLDGPNAEQGSRTASYVAVPVSPAAFSNIADDGHDSVAEGHNSTYGDRVDAVAGAGETGPEYDNQDRRSLQGQEEVQEDSDDVNRLARQPKSEEVKTQISRQDLHVRNDSAVPLAGDSRKLSKNAPLVWDIGRPVQYLGHEAHASRSNEDDDPYPEIQDYRRNLTSNLGRTLIDIFLIVRWGFVEMLSIFFTVLYELYVQWHYLGCLNMQKRWFEEGVESWVAALQNQHRVFDEAQTRRERLIKNILVEEEEEFQYRRGYTTTKEDDIRRQIFCEAQYVRNERFKTYLRKRWRECEDAPRSRKRQFKEWKEHVMKKIDQECEEALEQFIEEDDMRRKEFTALTGIKVNRK